MTLNIPMILSTYLFYNQEISLIFLLDIDLKKPISHCVYDYYQYRIIKLHN